MECYHSSTMAATANTTDEIEVHEPMHIAAIDPIDHTTTKLKPPSHSIDEKEQQFKVHIAIDFGTDGVGLSYAYNGKVFVHSKWDSKKYGDQIKPKSLILLDSKGQTMAFGLDAKFRYQIYNLLSFFVN